MRHLDGAVVCMPWRPQHRISPRDAVRAYRDTLVQAALHHRHRHRGAGAGVRDEPVRSDPEPGLRAGFGRRAVRSAVPGDRLAGRGHHRLGHLVQLAVRVLQVTAADKAGLEAVLLAATNSSAGVMGKMLSPQNLAVAAAAVGMVGKEGDIFRRLIGWGLGLLAAFIVFVCCSPPMSFVDGAVIMSTPLLDALTVASRDPVRVSDNALDRHAGPRRLALPAHAQVVVSAATPPRWAGCSRSAPVTGCR